MGDGRVALRADPAHKLVNPVLYRLEEAKACWHRITAPALWIEGEHSQSSRALRLTQQDRDNRRSHIARVTCRVISDAGHMVHHDQPELVARLIEAFLLANTP